MRVILDLNPEKYGKMRRLVDDKRYDSVSQFIDTAIENQLHLESVDPLDRERALDDALGGFDVQVAVPEETSHAVAAAKLGLTSASIVTVDEPVPKMLDSDYLWMMVNRILPIKVALRSFEAYLSNNPTSSGWTNLVAVHDAAVREAIRIGRLLQANDRRRGNGDKLAIGFPSSRDEKSQSRFKWFCVGALKSNGLITGGPAWLHFVNIIKDSSGNVMIGLTKAGVEFADLKNPAIDAGDSSPLSPAETDYLLSHIRRVLPKEHRVMLTVVDSITKGRNTPNELIEPVKSVLDTDDAESISQRASLVSRLAEMGLVVRKRNGLHITYELTDRARTMLKSEAAPTSVVS